MRYILLFTMIAFVSGCSKDEDNPTKPQVIIAQGLVAYYPFNGNANDESGNGNNGTNNGSTLTSDRFGNENSAFKFNGVNSYIRVPHHLSLNFGEENEFTVSMWIKLQSTQNYPTSWFVAALVKSIDTAAFQLGTVSTKISAEYRVKNNFGTVVNVSGLAGIGSTVITDNQWHFLSVVVRRNLTSAQTYVDKILQTNVTDALLAKNVSNTSDLYIGGDFFNNQVTGDRFIKGDLDDIRIYKRALSVFEIQQLYHESGWE